MYEQVILWVGFAFLVLLCLPIAAFQKAVLELTALALRLTMLGLLAGGAYLWFRPGHLPAEVSTALNNFPGLLSLLPERGSPAFALCLACWIVAALVPLLAILDVCRKLAGRRMSRIRTLTAHPVTARQHDLPAPRVEVVEPVQVPVEAPMPVRVPVLRPVERRTAADVIANLGTRPAR